MFSGVALGPRLEHVMSTKVEMCQTHELTFPNEMQYISLR